VFDAYKFRFGLGAFYLDIFGAKMVDTNPPGGSGRTDQDFNFSGAYFSKEGDRLELLDVYWLRLNDKSDPATGRIRRNTTGILGQYLFRNDLTLEVEYAYQWGDSADVDIRAQMAAVELDWRGSGSRELGATVGFDWATGDSDGLDNGRIETFDQLFPSPHPHLGQMDYAGRQNIQDIWGAFGLRLLRAWRARVEGHYLRLDAAQDAWYVAEGGVNGGAGSRFDRDPARTASDLGIELDVLLDVDFAEGSTVHLGYSHFFPGDVVRYQPGGGEARDDHSDFLFLSVAIAF
jgi:hypothetical protein